MKKHVYVSKHPDSNNLISWSPTENETWSVLLARQKEIIKNYACQEFLQGIDKLDFPLKQVPQLPEINKKLKSSTGWSVQGVPAIIGPKEFFELLANKKFPAATFIRIPEELDYIQEPDIFHELFGHGPMLTNQVYADFMHEFGKRALAYEGRERSRMFRLFWFTVEFGLIKQDKQIKAYGSGILSSIGETQYCLTSKSKKLPFDPLTILRTPFKVDIMQPLYYVLDAFTQLFQIFDQNLDELLKEAARLGDLKPEFKTKEEIKEIDGAMTC